MTKIAASGFIHLAFIGFIVIVNFLHGIFPSIYNLQSFYYFFCMIVLLAGFGWLLSAMAAFITDVVNLIAVAIQIGFWATPIFWSPDSMSPMVQTILKLNPMFYVCTGYRDSFINKIWFWERPIETIYFWVVAFAILCYGIYTFKRLRPHFDDVL